MDEQEFRIKELRAAQRYRKAVFPLDGGDVEITYPANMSEDDLHALDRYLSIFLKRGKPKETRHDP